MYDGSIYVRHDVRHQEASTFSKDTSFSLSEAMNGEEHILCFLDLRSQSFEILAISRSPRVELQIGIAKLGVYSMKLDDFGFGN